MPYTVTRHAHLIIPVLLQAQLDAQSPREALNRFAVTEAQIIHRFEEDSELRLTPHEKDHAEPDGTLRPDDSEVYQLQIWDELHFVRASTGKPLAMLSMSAADNTEVSTLQSLITDLGFTVTHLNDQTEAFETFYMGSNPQDPDMDDCHVTTWLEAFLAEHPAQQSSLPSLKDYTEESDGHFPVANLDSPAGRIALGYDEHERLGVRLYPTGTSYSDWYRMDRLAGLIPGEGGKTLAGALYRWSSQAPAGSWPLDLLADIQAAASQEAIEAVLQAAASLQER